MNYILLFVVGILFVIGEVVEGKGFLFIEFVEYNNTRGLGSNGQCCDGRWGMCQKNGCDHCFEICLTETGGIRGDHTGCLVTDSIKNKNTIAFEDRVGDLANPIKIPRHDLVKDYDLRVEINDYDRMNKNDHVDTLHTHIHFNYSSIISEPILLSGRTQLLLIVWYECDEGFYDCESCEGQGLCTRHCVVPPSGNGYCDFYGNLVCNQGWMGDDCSVEMTTPPTNSSGRFLPRYVARDLNKV